MKLPVATFAVALDLACAATGVSAQPNLLANPGFDADLGGWEIAFDRPAAWSPDDLLGDPQSGAALVTHDEPLAGGFLTILRQCVPIDGPGDFRIAGWVRNLPDQGVPGSAAIVVAPVRHADCTGGAGTANGTQAVSASNWQYRETTFSVSHDTVAYQAVEVRLAVLKAQAVVTPRAALFDEVELVSLAPVDAVFADGFDTPPATGAAGASP